MVGAQVAVRVRRIAPDDGERLRAVRLAALAEAPEAFWQTLSGESARPRRDWDARARRNASGDEHATFLLERWPPRAAGVHGEAVGMVDVYQPTRAPEFRELAAMWVAPAARGTAAAGALLGTAVDWARSVGAVGVRLWVATTNLAAARFYRRHGFQSVGPPQGDDGDPPERVYEPMLLVLDGRAATSPTFLARALAPWTDESG